MKGREEGFRRYYVARSGGGSHRRQIGSGVHHTTIFCRWNIGHPLLLSPDCLSRAGNENRGEQSSCDNYFFKVHKCPTKLFTSGTPEMNGTLAAFTVGLSSA